MGTRDASATSRTALITGSTSGLGLACARSLVGPRENHWNLILTGRDPEKGRIAVESLKRAAKESTVQFYELDLGSFASIRELAGRLREQQVRLDALVCNAGVQFTRDGPRTAQGHEPTFGINHLGHFLLVHRLAPLLKDTARIVIVSSSTHDPLQKTGMASPRWVDPRYLAKPEEDSRRQFEADEAPARTNQRRYTTSKLCNLYFAYELDRRIHAAQPSVAIPGTVTVNAFDPGLMPGTSLGRGFTGPQRIAWRYVMPALRPVLRAAFGNVHTPAESGAALAELVDASRFARTSGTYFEGLKEVRSSAESLDVARARGLWEASERLSETTPPAVERPRA